MHDHWKRKRSILSCLINKNFVSGETIATELSISRAAVNKHIENLIDYGVEIFSVKGKGYKLSKPIYLVDEKYLLENVDNRCFYFDEINSTNAYMLTHANELKSGDFCVAEYQSAGRGRRGRTWVSPYGNHLYFSMLWQFEQGLAQTMGLSLVVGCSLVNILSGMGIHGLGLKWPNDVYLDNKKLAGVLVEMTGQMDNKCQLIIGVGLNLAMSSSQGQTIDQPWSDLCGVIDSIDKTELIIKLQQQLKIDLQLFEKQGLQPFLTHWKKWDIFNQQPVSLLLGDNQIDGICQGINEQGAILLKTSNKIEAFVGGEITLRPMSPNM